MPPPCWLDLERARVVETPSSGWGPDALPLSYARTRFEIKANLNIEDVELLARSMDRMLAYIRGELLG